MSRNQETMMLAHRFLITLATCALALVGLSPVAAGQFSLTVNRDRLINASNEPQNWLLMNGDYGSLRYSKLTQINRGNVKTLRMVWALALGGMQDVGQNGPESELHPLVDNGFMYTSDGWGTIYKIDARHPNRGQFVWVADPGVAHQGNISRSRGIALWEDKVYANLPDGRVIAVNRDTGEIVWDQNVAVKNEFGSRERFLTAPLVADGKVIVQNGAGDSATRGWVAALDAGTGKELWRWYVVPKPGRTTTTPGRPVAAVCGRPARTTPIRTCTSLAQEIRCPSTTRSSVPATTSTPTPWSRSTSRPAG
jgi:alcohol dehydrogenase (cytochrome c)